MPSRLYGPCRMRSGCTCAYQWDWPLGIARFASPRRAWRLGVASSIHDLCVAVRSRSPGIACARRAHRGLVRPPTHGSIETAPPEPGPSPPVFALRVGYEAVADLHATPVRADDLLARATTALALARRRPDGPASDASRRTPSPRGATRRARPPRRDPTSSSIRSTK